MNAGTLGRMGYETWTKYRSKEVMANHSGQSDETRSNDNRGHLAEDRQSGKDESPQEHHIM
jgi:hypothetical protein